jgi:hypothetical protein
VGHGGGGGCWPRLHRSGQDGGGAPGGWRLGAATSGREKRWEAMARSPACRLVARAWLWPLPIGLADAVVVSGRMSSE